MKSTRATSSHGSSSSVVRACHHLAALGFVASTDGNVSIRLDDRRCLITASGASFSAIRASEVLSMRFDAPGSGRRRPSSEASMHIALYQKDMSIGAVVHAHPAHATAFAATGTRLTPNVFPEVILDLGDVPLVRYAMPSSDHLGELVARYADTGHAALLANHGAVTWGRSLEEAIRRMEKLEQIATIEHLARALGGLRSLTPEQIAELRSQHPLSPWKNG